MNVTKVTNVTKVLVTFSLSDIVVTFLVTVVTFQKVVKPAEPTAVCK